MTMPDLEGGRLDDGRRVLGVWAGIQIAVAVGLVGGDQRDMRRQIDEIAAEQLEIGVDRAELDFAPAQRTREGCPLRTGIGEVELARDAALEQVEVGLQNDAGLHDVQIMDLLPVDARQNFSEKIGLLLVVALEADPIARADDRLEKRLCALRPRHLAAGEAGTSIQAGVPLAPLLLPVSGAVGVPTADGSWPICEIGAS